MNIQSLKQLPIISESVTIDITPLSRYGRENDIAKITSNIRLSAPLEEETNYLLPVCNSLGKTKVYLPNGDTIVNDFDPTAEADVNSLKTLMEDSLKKFEEIPSNENMNIHVANVAAYNEFKGTSQVITIPKGEQYITFSYSKTIEKTNEINKLETIVPLSSFTLQTGGKANIIILMPFEITDASKIQKANWTAPNGEVQNLKTSTEAGRIVLSQNWQNDPSVLVEYVY